MIDVAIVGGGHAGLLLAASLAPSGWSVAIVDPQGPDEMRAAPPDGRTLALLAGSRQILERAGLAAAVDAAGAPIWATHVVDVAGRAAIDYDASAELGHPFGLGIENRLLRTALLEAAEARAGVAAFRRDRLTGLTREGGRIRLDLASGASLSARLVVGADGRGSRVRDLAHLGLERWAYEQSALAFVVAHASDHAHAVHERLRPGGPLATLPLPGRRSGITWVEPHARAQALKRLPVQELLALMEQDLPGIFGETSVEGPIGIWPLSAQHAKRYVAPRVALMGDAAHGSHPIHAQGFNMGVGDVGALIRLLGRAAERGQDPGSPEVLVAYERERRPENARRLLLTDGLNRVFSNDVAALATIRGFGLRALDAATPLKRMAIRHGMQLA